MKHFPILLTALFFVFFSCNNAAEDTKSNDTDSKEHVESSDTKKAEPEKKQAKTIRVDEPTKVNINDIKEGAEFFGLTVSEANIPSEKEFSFTIAEEFILKGNVSEGEEGITFMADNPTRSNAILEFSDMEKPFFMWTTFNNLETFMAALSDEQKQKANSMDGFSIQLKMKNYKVGADAQYFWIGASADFVEIVE